jgi:metal iron transporter
MSELKARNVSTVIPERTSDLIKKEDQEVLETVTSVPDYHRRRWWDAVKSVLLAKTPVRDAPLEYGGHRVAEEPKNLSFVGVLAKFARFFGPGMIVTVAYIDPDNFQTSFEDGQDFGYEMLFMLLISLLMAIYLQVSVLASMRCSIMFCMIVTN